ncbi:tetratricopeptide repeat-containing glycosyltransferase family protein [Shimia sp. SDUM112013]|uniref:tetratricopeptide repeat-containing glycosyltransferase family protein n=1 Tax=Shimia sp. SDUM112013 TaxID=3136160 RepID=UPI0032F02EE8
MASNSDELKTQAVACHKAGDHEKALALYGRALARWPQDVDLLSNLGVLLRAEKRLEDALEVLFLAHERAPDRLSVRVSLANILDDMGRHDEAATLRFRIVEDQPEEPRHVAFLARSLRNAGRLEEAANVLRKQLAKANPTPELRLEYALHQLSLGNYAEGFRHYLARREAKLVDLPNTDLPRWTGQPIDGKTILVLPEQGMGDVVNFARFLPYLKERGATVHLMTRAPVHRLLQGVPGVDAVVTDPVRGTEYAYWTSGMDIPVDYFHFRQSVPQPTRLSVPDDSRKRAISLTQAHRDKLKVGVAWTGSAGYDRNTMRSVPHRLFRDLADIPGLQLFSLYKGPALSDFYADGSAAFILDVASGDRDLADCAAMIAEMDIVVTVCTVTAHIAGALRKEVWTLLHWEPFWLYGLEGETTPWYDSMRLFRQEYPYDWTGVFSEVRQGLTDKAEDKAKCV